MSIFDIFRKISGAEIYRETCELIKEHRLRYQVEAVVPTDSPEELEERHKMKRKSFYLDGFSNKDWFVQLKYCPVDGKFLPFLIRICTTVDIRPSETGILCKTNDISDFSYHVRYNLSYWKRVKAELVKALEHAEGTSDRVFDAWGDWLSGEEDKNLIHYEQAKKPLKITIKKGPKTPGGASNA